MTSRQSSQRRRPRATWVYVATLTTALVALTACGADSRELSSDSASCRLYMEAAEADQKVVVNKIATDQRAPEAVTADGRERVATFCAANPDRMLSDAVAAAHEGAAAPGTDAGDTPDSPEAGPTGGAALPVSDRTEVLTAVTEAVEEVLGYDHRTLEKDREDALALMTTAYGDSFTSVFDTAVSGPARQNRAVVTAEVHAAGITAVAADTIDVIVFADQSTTSTASAQPQEALQRLDVTMVRDDDAGWLVDDILNDTFATPDDEPVRLEVMTTAQRFAEEWNTFESGGAQEYVERVRPLLSEAFAADVDAHVDEVVDGIDEGLSSTATVRGAGVVALDDDTATVLVATDTEQTSDGDTSTRYLRYEVELLRADGEWLVDRFAEV